MLADANSRYQIGGYLVERELGRGGMGVVYAAVELRSGRHVALKLLAPHLLSDLRQHRRLLREARATTRLRHPSLVRVYGYHHRDAQPYLVMEHVPGLSLRAHLLAAPQQRLSLELAIEITLQLAEALTFLHDSGIVHRDIKPSNIMITYDAEPPERPQIKLLDFGLARYLGHLERTPQSSSDVTGTPAYMSPEQCQGTARIDGSSDVYALGALCFEMLCGRPPFVGDPPRIMFQHVYEAPYDPRQLRPEISEALGELIQKMLAKAPAQRPGLHAIASALRELRGGGSTAEVPPVRRSALRGLFMTMVMAVVLCGLGLAGWRRHLINAPIAQRLVDSEMPRQVALQVPFERAVTPPHLALHPGEAVLEPPRPAAKPEPEPEPEPEPAKLKNSSADGDVDIDYWE